METKMKNQITYNVKTEIKPGVFEEYVKDDVEINQEYLAIPRDILIDKELKANERIIMGFAISFINNNKVAFASNRLLGALVNLSPSRVSSIISRLVKKKYLHVVLYRNSDGRIIKRNLLPHKRYLNFSLNSSTK